MKAIAKSMDSVINQTKVTMQNPQSLEVLKNSVSLQDDPEGKRELCNFLLMCFNSLKLYGKQPSQMEDTVILFQVILAGYPFEKIKQAFVFYLKNNTDLPTPADILQIIERGNKPPFDKAVYVSISKKLPEDRDKDDWQYLRDYERFIVTGKN